MTVFFEIAVIVLGIVLALFLWALHKSLYTIYQAQRHDSQQALEFMQHEIMILWTALSSEQEARFKRRAEYGLGALFVHDEEISTYIGPHRRRYQTLKEEYEQRRDRWCDYKDSAEKTQKEKELEELRLEVRSMSASLTPEEKLTWDKISDERWRQSLEGLKAKPK